MKECTVFGSACPLFVEKVGPGEGRVGACRRSRVPTLGAAPPAAGTRQTIVLEFRRRDTGGAAVSAACRPPAACHTHTHTLFKLAVPVDLPDEGFLTDRF